MDIVVRHLRRDCSSGLLSLRAVFRPNALCGRVRFVGGIRHNRFGIGLWQQSAEEPVGAAIEADGMHRTTYGVAINTKDK
jgi:hypothetical protein